jgi:hypothetical protein
MLIHQDMRLFVAGTHRSAVKCLLICSAGPRGLCGDPRFFDDLTKVPQVFRNPGGSPALQNLSAFVTDPPDFVAAIV